jgi:hypothetical protein
MKLFGSEPRDVLAYYRSLGFELRVQNSEAAGTTALSDDELIARCPEQDERAFVNLLLSRP